MQPQRSEKLLKILKTVLLVSKNEVIISISLYFCELEELSKALPQRLYRVNDVPSLNIVSITNFAVITIVPSFSGFFSKCRRVLFSISLFYLGLWLLNFFDSNLVRNIWNIRTQQHILKGRLQEDWDIVGFVSLIYTKGLEVLSRKYLLSDQGMRIYSIPTLLNSNLPILIKINKQKHWSWPTKLTFLPTT